KRELPFVVGVLAPLSGNAEVSPFEEREAIEMDRLNFDDVMKKIGPKVEFGGMTLKFDSMEEFEPENLASKIPTLAAKLDRRRALSDALMRLRANGRLRCEVQRVVEQTRAGGKKDEQSQS